MSVDNPDNGDAKPETETPTELRKMKTNACMPNNMTQNAVVQPLLTGLLLFFNSLEMNKRFSKYMMLL